MLGMLHWTLDAAAKAQLTKCFRTNLSAAGCNLACQNVTMLGVLVSGAHLIATMQSRLSRTMLSHLAFCELPLLSAAAKVRCCLASQGGQLAQNLMTEATVHAYRRKRPKYMRLAGLLHFGEDRHQRKH